MSMKTVVYGLIFFTCAQVLVKASAMSSPLREDAAPLLLYNPSGHDLEPFEYAAVKRESERPRETLDISERSRRKEHPGASYIRIGRSQEQVEAGDRATRGRSDNIIRFGRSSLKVPQHKIDHLGGGRGFLRIGKSGSSVFARLGRSVVPALPSEAGMAILCPNILVEEDARGGEDLQLYLAKLVYICNNNNNNADRSEDNNSHRNNLEFVEVNGDTV